MRWEVEYTDEFGAWWSDLTAEQQVSIAATVELLARFGPSLGYPHSTGVESSRHSHMRELRVQHRGEPIRIFYAFDPRRVAILLIGGGKAGDDRFYERMVPVGDRLYDEHLDEIAPEDDSGRN